MAKPRIVQCLCGPNRHAIIGFLYEPGVSFIGEDLFGSSEEVTLTESNVIAYTTRGIDVLIKAKSINPWCGICRSPRQAWIFEDAATRFNTLEEALPAVRTSEAAQAATRRFLHSTRN